MDEGQRTEGRGVRGLPRLMGLYSKWPGKSVEHPSGTCAETRVATAREERVIVYFMTVVAGGGGSIDYLIVWGYGMGGM